MELPFVSPSFSAAWADWTEHRKQLKRPLTPIAIRNQFLLLKKMGEPAAIAAIRHSLANSYQGIFEPRVALSPARGPLERPMVGRVDPPRPRGNAPDELYTKGAEALRLFRKSL